MHITAIYKVDHAVCKHRILLAFFAELLIHGRSIPKYGLYKLWGNPGEVNEVFANRVFKAQCTDEIKRHLEADFVTVEVAVA